MSSKQRFGRLDIFPVLIYITESDFQRKILGKEVFMTKNKLYFNSEYEEGKGKPFVLYDEETDTRIEVDAIPTGSPFCIFATDILLKFPQKQVNGEIEKAISECQRFPRHADSFMSDGPILLSKSPLGHADIYVVTVQAYKLKK